MGVSKDVQAAEKLYRMAAEGGLPEAMRAVGKAYDLGLGEQKNPVEACKWYRRAFVHGDAIAAVRLGEILSRGDEGVPKNVNEAIKLWNWAATLGNAYAQLHLGESYMSGNGVTRDLAKAHEFLTKAGSSIDVSKQLKDLSASVTPAKLIDTSAANR
jgi:hypothetical protein